MPSDPTITVLDRVKMPDGSYYRFAYNRYGQAVKFSRYAPNNQEMAYIWYDAAHAWIPDSNPPLADCPRFTMRRDWARDWNNNQPAETLYTVDPAGGNGSQPAWSQVETPDHTRYRENYYTGGVFQGLTQSSEVYAWSGVAHIRKKWTTTAWGQEGADPTQLFNPRPTEINVYDDPDGDGTANNHRRTTIAYTN